MTRVALELREGGDADEEAIVELLRASLGEGQIPRTAEFFRWKHREGPFGPSPCRVAFAGPRLVGVRLFLRWRFRDGDRVVGAVRAVDTATHPEFQGQGIFSKLTLGLVADETARGTGFVFNTPNEKSRPGYLKMGWESLGRISLWVRPGPGALRAGAARLLGGRGAGGAPPDLVPRAGARRFDVALAERLEAASLGARGLRTPRSPGYLRWRYERCPAFEYRFHERDDALVVTRVRERFGLRELTLCEVLPAPSPRGARAAAAAVWAAVAAERPDHSVAAAPRDPAALSALALAGFVPAPRSGPILTVRRLAGAPPTRRGPGSLAGSIGDLELF